LDVGISDDQQQAGCEQEYAARLRPCVAQVAGEEWRFSEAWRAAIEESSNFAGPQTFSPEALYSLQLGREDGMWMTSVLLF
jgi:hypothetical protein